MPGDATAQRREMTRERTGPQPTRRARTRPGCVLRCSAPSSTSDCGVTADLPCVYGDIRGGFRSVEGRSALRRIIRNVQMPTTPTLTGDEAARVERGFLHLHSELSQGHVNLRELATTALALVDLLVAQGF